jgi:7,8-dihydropterin-6-yl-methyl-4-(beta-D-ribofuranosyl)aminobenzene 5'-phosphate synthase
MKRYGLFIMLFPLLLGARGDTQVLPQSLTITYLYDNTTSAADTKADWGFSCLVEGNGNQVLFDAGANPQILRANMAALHVDAARIRAVVFSHEHADHTGGVEALGERPDLPTFFPSGFGETIRAAFLRQRLRLMPVAKATAVGPGLATSDEIGTQIREEALVAEISDGLVVVSGCAHPGIIPMLKQISASRKRPIHMVLGGFHLLETPADEVKRIVSEFQAMGIAYAGPTHCTGDEAMKLFQTAYGTHFIRGGVGTMVRVPRAAGR